MSTSFWRKHFICPIWPSFTKGCTRNSSCILNELIEAYQVHDIEICMYLQQTIFEGVIGLFDYFIEKFIHATLPTVTGHITSDSL